MTQRHFILKKWYKRPSVFGHYEIQETHNVHIRSKSYKPTTIVKRIEDKEMAEYIVTACNAYPDLDEDRKLLVGIVALMLDVFDHDAFDEGTMSRQICDQGHAAIRRIQKREKAKGAS